MKINRIVTFIHISIMKMRGKKWERGIYGRGRWGGRGEEREREMGRERERERERERMEYL